MLTPPSHPPTLPPSHRILSMSRFSTDFAAVGLPQLHWMLGEAATYTPVEGAAGAVTLIIENQSSGVIEADDGLVRVSTLTAELLLAEVPTRRAGDVLSLSGVEWGWVRDGRIGGGRVSCEFERSEPLDKTRGGRRTRGAP